MPWWGWVALGTLLLAAEVGIQTEFWLACIGAAALLVGASLWAGIPQPLWLQWLCFAALSILAAVTVRSGMSRWLSSRAAGLAPELEGDQGTSQSEIAPDHLGSVEVRGSTWRARNVGETPLKPGDPIQVVSVVGLTLNVRG